MALLNALHAYKREFVSTTQLAEEACELEMIRLGDPVGKQDQYIAAFGNVTALTIDPSGEVHAEPVPIRDEVMGELENNLVALYSGIERPASAVLAADRRGRTPPCLARKCSAPPMSRTKKGSLRNRIVGSHITAVMIGAWRQSPGREPRGR